MDSRIGQLIREGQTIYYINLEDGKTFEHAKLEEVVAWLEVIDRVRQRELHGELTILNWRLRSTGISKIEADRRKELAGILGITLPPDLTPGEAYRAQRRGHLYR